MNFPAITFKHWMAKGELAKFARAMTAYWRHVQAALELPLRRFDPLTAPLELVKLVAWERDVESLDKEPENIFRLRVTHAFRFAKDGGDVKGFVEMLHTLGVNFAVLHERQPEIDFDIITIETGSSDLANNAYLIHSVIRQYCRTCRRYRINVTFPATQKILHGQFSHSLQIYSASM